MAKFNIFEIFKHKQKPVEEMSFNKLLKEYKKLNDEYKKLSSSADEKSKEQLDIIEGRIDAINQQIKTIVAQAKEPQVLSYIKKTEEDFAKYVAEYSLCLEIKQEYEKCYDRMRELDAINYTYSQDTTRPMALTFSEKEEYERCVEFCKNNENANINVIIAENNLSNIMETICNFGINTEKIKELRIKLRKIEQNNLEIEGFKFGATFKTKESGEDGGRGGMGE